MGKEGISTVAFFQHQEPWEQFSRLQGNTQQGKKIPLASAFMGLETVFSLLSISQGFLESIYYSERFESVVLVVRLLSKFLAFLAESQVKRPLNQSRPFNLPGSPLALLSQGKEWGGDMIILASVSRESK